MNQPLLEVAMFYSEAEAAYRVSSSKLRECVFVCARVCVVWKRRETATRVDWIIYSAAGVRSICTQLPESLKWCASFLSCHSCIMHTHLPTSLLMSLFLSCCVYRVSVTQWCREKWGGAAESFSAVTLHVTFPCLICTLIKAQRVCLCGVVVWDRHIKTLQRC